MRPLSPASVPTPSGHLLVSPQQDKHASDEGKHTSSPLVGPKGWGSPTLSGLSSRSRAPSAPARAISLPPSSLCAWTSCGGNLDSSHYTSSPASPSQATPCGQRLPLSSRATAVPLALMHLRGELLPRGLRWEVVVREKNREGDISRAPGCVGT